MSGTARGDGRRRQRGQRWRLAVRVALGLVLLAVAEFVGSMVTGATKAFASSETVSYDPETCKTNPGDFVFVALGRTVLKVPADELTNIRGMSAKRYAELPQPPDPDEPEGCRDHPMRGSGFSFAYRYNAVLHNKFDPRQPPGTPNQLSIIAARPDQWGLQRFAEEYLKSRCRREGVREELPNGLIACRVQPEDRSILPSHWGVSYRAKLQAYPAPLDRPFIVDCRPAGPNGVQPCQVNYKLNDALNVSYEFFPHNVPIADIIDFDRGLRARIEAAIVEDFVWPGETDDNIRTPKAGGSQ